MEKETIKRRKTIVLITLIIALLIVIADSILYYTSLQETGVGRGFSRYFDSID
ncbi:MAG: hypothetical protein XD93_0241 [candidate division WS6 bacterium 34_10]|uniref:Uncharacterized protein n=1 Tax=candidate division WS6 bacterium 34_10 TaxID=1641389 RepID=A0A101HIQ2_9BACT|nr:MAG: hypothetical protein XD93_0241 [candidate division WS6 bacterium 34_10]